MPSKSRKGRKDSPTASTSTDSVVPLGTKWHGRLQVAAAFLLGLLLFWTFSVPNDSTSVFAGDALAQNLFWLALGILVAATAAIHGGFEFPRWPVWICVVGLCWLILCTISAGATDNPRVGWNGFWQVMAFASCYFSVRGLLYGTQTRLALLGVLLAGCIAMSCQGIYQVGIVFPAARAEFEQDPDGTIAKIPNFYAPEGSPQRQRYIDRLNSPEPLGTFALANSLGTLLSMGLVTLLGVLGLLWLRYKQSRGSLSSVHWATLGAATLLIGVVWLLTRSRTAYLATIVGLGYLALAWFVVRPRSIENQAPKRYSWKSWGLVCLPIVALAGGFIWLLRNDSLVLSEAPKSIQFRLEYWIATVNMIADHGLQGVGLGNFRNYYTQYKLPAASEEIADPHNWILDIAATLSVPIALALVAWFVKILSEIRLGQWSSVQDEVAAKTDRSAKQDSRIAKMVLLGLAAGGALCGVMLNAFNGFDLDMLFVGWIPAGVFLWLFWRNLSPVIEDEMAIRWISCGSLCTLLVSLLANGSWQASGLGIPIVVLAALGVATQRGSQLGGVAQDRTGIPMHTWAVIMPALGFLVFIFQSWRPVLLAWMQLVAFESAATPRLAEQAVSAAMIADPMDAQYRELKVEVEFRSLMSRASDFESKAKACLATIDDWLSRDQHRFTNWRTAGYYASDIAARAESLGLPASAYHEAAAQYATRAVELYPNSVELHVQLALYEALAGRKEEYLAGVAEAERLSKLTPHADKQLEMQLIRTVSERVPAEIKGQMDLVKAELLIQWLRSNELALFGDSDD